MIPPRIALNMRHRNEDTETTNRSKILCAILLFLDGDVLFLLQGMCTHLSDWHSAENVEEDEGAVSVILTQEVAVGETLDVREGDKRKLCHHSAIKSEIESTGSPLETAKELLDIERTSEHLQQATRAGKTTWKAKKPCCLLQPLCIHYTKEDKDISLSSSSPHSTIHRVGLPQEQSWHNQSAS